MIRKEKEGLHWLEFELFSEFPKLKAFVVLRRGGFSKGPYESLNLNFHVGDDHELVQANLQKMTKILELPQVISGNQVHGIEIEHLATPDCYPKKPCDGLTTALPHRALLIHHADCQAAIFYDPIQHALAAVHCGWRGNVQNIYAETIQRMAMQFHSKPENLFVAISPSLGPENGEFIHFKKELPESFWPFQIRPTFFDLWAISAWQLQQSGILPHHIQIARIDTYAHTEDYFSYRRSKTRGGNATIAMLT